MTEILFSEFALRAYAAAAAVGAAAPLIGSFLIQRRLALIGDGVGHLAFAGVALGVLAGVSPLLGALVTALAGAGALEWLRIRGRLSGDLSLALVFYFGIALGAVVLSSLGRFDASLLGVLFGSIFAVSTADVLFVVGLCAAVAGVTVLFYKELLAVALDEDSARAAGLPVDGLNLLVVAMTAMLVAAGMRAVGLLLIASLLVVPVAAGSRVAHSFRGSMLWAAALGVASALVGLVVALVEGSVAPGGAIVLAAIAMFVAATLLGRRAARRHRPRAAGPAP